MRSTFQSLAVRNPRPRHSGLLFYWDLSSWFERKKDAISIFSPRHSSKHGGGSQKHSGASFVCQSVHTMHIYEHQCQESFTSLLETVALAEPRITLVGQWAPGRQEPLSPSLHNEDYSCTTPLVGILGYYGLNSGPSVWATITLLSEPSSQWHPSTENT